MAGQADGAEVAEAIRAQTDAVLAAYAADPHLVEEHAGQEREARTGGYGRRQIFELVQNGADQLEAGRGRLQVVVAERALYCANQGRPFSPKGIESILHAYLSRKDDEQIGRFGLGFKSVLGVTSRPAILSRAGSFRFGPDVAKRIREVAPEADELPLLRIAEPFDPAEVTAEDAVAAELAEWATTVIVLPFDEPEPPAWLAVGIRDFPAAFLLFAEHVSSLVLEDREAGSRREISAEREGDGVLLREGGEEDFWLVFDTPVELDATARQRAGKLAERDRASVVWAVTPQGSRELGRFWSYFPTDDETTLRGVLNAPWQLSEDRRRLVEGAYNEALLEGAAELILDSLDALREHEEDKTRYLELLPARGREPRCWADGLLTEKTNELVRFRPSVPLLDGDLELPQAARLHPPDLPDEALALWAAVAAPGQWIDHRIERQKDRRARVERYLSDTGRTAASLDEWMVAALEDVDPGVASGVALARLGGALGESDGEALSTVPFVLTDDLAWVPPTQPGLMLPGDYAAAEEGVTLVHPEVSADERARAALEAFGLRPISAEVELRRLVREQQPEDEEDWTCFWQVARQVPSPRAAELIAAEEAFEPRVRTLAGDFKRVRATLLPGPCVPADGSRDAQATVDVPWHRSDLDLLRTLGCTEAPSIGARVTREPWFGEYRSFCVETFLRRNEPARPSEESIQIAPDSLPVGPLTVLRGLSDEGRAALTQAALQSFDGVGAWSVRHATQARYEEAAVPNPSIWLIREEGRLQTPWGPRLPAECIGPELSVGELAPVPSCSSEVARALGLPAGWDEVPDAIVAECLRRAAAADPAQAAELYGALAGAGIDPPAELRCIQGGVAAFAAAGAVAVTDDESIFELLARGSACVLKVADREAVEMLIERWGLEDAGMLVARRIAFVAQGDPVALIDEFQPLRRLLDPALRGLVLQRCEEIRLVEEAVGGTRSRDVDFARDEETLYCLVDVSSPTLLRQISRELGLGLDAEAVERVIRGVEDRKAKALIRAVREAPADAERLALLFDAAILRGGLPRAVLDIYTVLHGEPDEGQLAELALSVHGLDVLKTYADQIEARGLTPPSTWGGSRPAREFVRALGFPVELAGFKAASRPRELIVEGRPKMPPLHDYQERLVEQLCSLFAARRENRAMLTLPTGSGKTRVAIEGCIEAIDSGLLQRDLILWVAQSDELCEQAVKAWSELWRARELEQRLTISRLWGANAVESASSGVQTVVATIQKLQNVIGSEGYEWLAKPGAVVIDEAHGSISPSYTRLLNWIGLERGKFGPPLLGLSATPYRGRSGVETERLAKRYGSRRLDVAVLGEGDHYEELQKEGVISRVEHRILEGSDIHLSEAEHKDVVERGWLPKEADTRLGENMERTKRVLDDICELPEDWPVLVFAPSVENAQALAGLLNHRGVSAAPISAETPDEARRWHLRNFKDGGLRVITNYSVLAEGFDAPSVRAVYIARPVFAPNRYQQMIGRGLRGPKNGGKEECLIVDVEDNVVNFDDLLAFRGFDYLWERVPSGAAEDGR
ncbi:MAG TPA: DEAD/DEAH box helicase [Solirubrobacterales bacterium]|nr:DEAD/DEAH box helicase [Solirubrobacterales bacterium]